MESTYSKTADQAATLGKRMHEEAAKFGQDAKSALGAATDAAKRATESARSQAQQLAGSTDQFVRVNPWQAVGLAAVTGLAIGILVGRKA